MIHVLAFSFNKISKLPKSEITLARFFFTPLVFIISPENSFTQPPNEEGLTKFGDELTT